MSTNTIPSVIVKLPAVRLSFPSLFEATKYGDEKEAKFKAVFILDKTKHAKTIAEIQKAFGDIVKQAKVKSLASYKLCLRDGAEKPDIDGYGETIMFLSASNKKPISVVDRDLSPLNAASGKPYAGCYVNASVRLWLQDNQWGKRINAQLRAVQFFGDGEVFGEKMADPNEEFENLNNDDGVL